MSELTPEPDSTSGERQKIKVTKIKIWKSNFEVIFLKKLFMMF
jgi:hypothetical protein